MYKDRDTLIDRVCNEKNPYSRISPLSVLCCMAYQSIYTRTEKILLIFLYMAGIIVYLYAQAAKNACFTEGAVIYSHIWHIYSRSIGD